jgi:hypothetical protein
MFPMKLSSRSLLRSFRRFLALGCLLLSAQLQAATSVGQNGVTWFFQGDRTVGQFVNGEWWVVGPVTITSITPVDPTPGDATDIHGSMVNPTKDQQGLDSRSKGDRYVASLNVARRLPITLQPGTSLMSGISHVAFDDGYLSKVAVLTVLAGPPPAGSFRPPWYGPHKPLFNESELNYSVLRKLAPTAAAQTPASLTNGDMKHVLIDLFTGGASANSEFKANTLTPHYGREISKATTRAALTLQLNYTDAQKRPLLIEVVQRGIDLYGSLLGGYTFTPDGGHNHGRKLAMYIAAKTLGHPDMLARCNAGNHPVFQEDQQHAFVTSAWTNHPASNIGMPEWAAQAFQRLDRPLPDWEATGYRFINGQANVGLVLTVTLMGGRAEWNHEALFRYIIERYWPLESSGSRRGIGSTNGIPTLTHQMWNAYFSGGSPPPPVVSRVALPTMQPGGGIFLAPTTVSLACATANATIHYTTNGSTPTSASPIYTGPFQVSTTSTVKAIATAPSLDNSLVREALFDFGPFTSFDEWQSLAIPSTWSTVSFTAVPSASPIDGVVGLGDVDEATSYADLACIMRFNPSGAIDVRNGGVYSADRAVSYTANTPYHFVVTLNMATKKYDVFVTPNGGTQVQLANDYSFRTEQQAISRIDTISFFTRDGATHAISNVGNNGGTLPSPPAAPSGLRVVPSP